MSNAEKPKWVPGVLDRTGTRMLGGSPHVAETEDDATARKGAAWIGEAALELGLIGAAWAAVVFVVKRLGHRS